MRSLAQARLKRSRAVQLAADGLSYDEIAREVGYAHRGSAHRAVFKALAENEAANVDELRHLELDRLDRAQLAIWGRVLDGDLAAVNAFLRIVDQRCRLLGLVGRESPSTDIPRTLIVGPAEGNPGRATAC